MAASSDIIPPELSASGYEHQQRPHGQRYTFTPEEMRLIRDCNRESFYYRSLPIASAAMLAVHYGVKVGYLAPNAKFGATIKVVGAGFLGWLVGKLSYQKTCEEKLMQLPGSVIGDALRRKRGVVLPERMDDSKNEDPHDFTLKDPKYATQVPDAPLRPQSQNTLGHTTYKGLDDSYRPSMDNPNVAQEPEILPPAKHVTSYDELRRMNREEHERRLAGAPPMSASTSPLSQQAPPAYTAAPEHQRSAFSTRPGPTTAPGSVPAQSIGRKKNEYGDTWDD